MNKTNILNRLKTYFAKPQNVILLLFGITLTYTTVAPIVAIVQDTFKIHPGTIDQYLTGKAEGYSVSNYTDLFTSRLAKTNLWMPILNTVLLAILTCLIAIIFKIQKVYQFYIYFSIHNASVDAGCCMAESL